MVQLRKRAEKVLVGTKEVCEDRKGLAAQVVHHAIDDLEHPALALEEPLGRDVEPGAEAGQRLETGWRVEPGAEERARGRATASGEQRRRAMVDQHKIRPNELEEGEPPTDHPHQRVFIEEAKSEEELGVADSWRQARAVVQPHRRLEHPKSVRPEEGRGELEISPGEDDIVSTLAELQRKREKGADVAVPGADLPSVEDSTHRQASVPSASRIVG
jgi:hypothetical protein